MVSWWVPLKEKIYGGLAEGFRPGFEGAAIAAEFDAEGRTQAGRAGRTHRFPLAPRRRISRVGRLDSA